jgi:hypothetical protein
MHPLSKTSTVDNTNTHKPNPKPQRFAQMCYDPVGTLLPLPGDTMDRSVAGGRFKVPASSISFANTVGVMVSVAAYDLVVAPMAARLGRPITTTARVGYGFVVAIAALLSGKPARGVGIGDWSGTAESVYYKFGPKLTHTHNTHHSLTPRPPCLNNQTK